MKNPSEILKPEALLAHGTFVRALAGRLVQDAHLAEDITQETWLAAIEKPPDEPRSIRAWLHTVARNFARRAQWDAGRRRKREKAAARPEGIRSTLEIVEQENIRRQVVEAVLELREPYKSAILFRFYDDLPPREIARRQDVPVETVKTRIQRGLEQLRIKLDGEHGGNRKNWCLALAPIAGWKLAASAAGAAGGALFVPGITAMTAKMKIAIAVGILLGAAFTFSQLLPDNKSHVGHDGDASPASLPGDAVASSNTDLLTHPQNTNDRVVMQASPTRILGRAVDEGAAPLGGINGLLLGEGGRRISTTTSNDAGAFQFEVEQVSKPEAVILEAAGRLPEAWLVPASEEPMIDLGELMLRPAGVLELNLGTADSTLLPPVDIHLLDERDNPIRLKEGLPETVRRALGKVQEVPPFLSLDMPVSLPAGRLAFTVPAGTWRLRVESKKHPLLESDPIEIRQDEWTRVFLEFEPVGEISGICVGLDGLPLAGVKMAASPVRFESFPEDYVILPENWMAGEKGITVTKNLYATTNRDGLFRFFPLPSGTWYDVWNNDFNFVTLERSPESSIESQIYPAGADNLRFVMKKVPKLWLTVEGPDGGKPGPGPGSAYLHITCEGWGCMDKFSLSNITNMLPLRYNHTFSEGRMADVQVSVLWGCNGFGQTELALPWDVDNIHGTVRIRPGIFHDLGNLPFPACAGVIGWGKAGEIHHEYISYDKDLPSPYFKANYNSDGPFVLGKDKATGNYWILTRETHIKWIALWDTKYQKLMYLEFDTESETPEILSEKIFETTDKMVFRLNDHPAFDPHDNIVGIVEAWLPERCGDIRLAQWWFHMNPNPGARVELSSRSPYQYDPAPGAIATLWRPCGLKYSISISANNEDGDDHRRLLRESFVLDGPKFFSIGKDD